MNIQQALKFLTEAVNPANIKMYRELSMMFHPDRNPEGAAKMAKLNAARDAGDWDTIRRMYRQYIATEEEETPISTPKTTSAIFKLYKDWAEDIEDELVSEISNDIHILIELQGNSANAWVQWLQENQRKQVYIPKIDRFKTKKDFKNEVLKKIKSVK